MNVVTPMRPARTLVNRIIFMVARVIPSTLSGLLGLSLIHFARWVIIRRDQWPDLGQGPQKLRNDYMLFCSNFNGTWDQYIDAFSDGIPSGLDLFWYSSTKYPRSVPITPFKTYIRTNQIDTDYYYNATPGAAQRDIKAALRVRRAILALARDHAAMPPEAFAEAYRRALVSVQNDLGSQGFAPVASPDTSEADVNRQPFVKDRWGACPASPLPA
jgi:hypothetical protein